MKTVIVYRYRSSGGPPEKRIPIGGRVAVVDGP